MNNHGGKRPNAGRRDFFTWLSDMIWDWLDKLVTIKHGSLRDNSPFKD
jgi:hypothetical protein